MSHKILTIPIVAAGAVLLAATVFAGQSADDAELPQLEIGLQESVELALRHNLQVRVNAFNQDLAEETVNSARARFDPALTFNIPTTFSRNTQPQTSQISGAEVLTNETLTGGFSFSETLQWGTNWSLDWNTRRSASNNTFSTFNPSYSSNTTLNFSQPLLNGFGKKVNTRGIVVARNDVSVSREQFREQVQNIAFQTYQAYGELVFAIRDLEVKRLALDLAMQQLERNRFQVEIGTLAPIETVQSEQAVADAEVALITAEIALNNAEDDLKQLVNIEAFSETGWYVRMVPTDEPATEIDPVNVDESLAEAFDNDPQLRQERVNLSSRRLDLDVARNTLLPQVNLQGSFTLQGQGGDRIIRGGFLGGNIIEIQPGGISDAISQMFSGDFRNWSVGLTVSFPLGNVAAEAQHAQASIRERQTLARIAGREQQVRVSIFRLARNIDSGNQGVAAARKARELAERQLDAEQRKFAVGTTTNFQVLELQRQLATAQTREIRAIIDLNVAQARFQQAKGTLLDSLAVSIRQAGVGGIGSAEGR